MAFGISFCVLWAESMGYKVLARDLLSQRSVITDQGRIEKRQISKDELLNIRDMIKDDGLYIVEMPESPYLRIGFHIAASYDKKLQRGGWGELPSRSSLRATGLMDDILIAYWDAMEEYYTSHQDDMYGMSKADFISFVIYMYSKSGIFSPNVTWRAGRPESLPDSGSHMLSGRPDMGPGMSTAFKPEANMTTPEYLREFFSRLGFDNDTEVALLLTAHALGSARGLPYLGELASNSVTHYNIDDSDTFSCGVGACYFWDMLNLEWEVGCPVTCGTCQWHSTWEMKAHYNSKDPYNTTWAGAPSNYTTESAWGDNCTLALKEQGGLFEYTDTATRSVVRLPAEMALLQDESYRRAMTWYSENSADDKTYTLDFARAYSKLLEVGVAEDQLYFIVDLEGATPPFTDAAGPPGTTTSPASPE
jgi:hypothetical protein